MNNISVFIFNDFSLQAFLWFQTNFGNVLGTVRPINPTPKHLGVRTRKNMVTPTPSFTPKPQEILDFLNPEGIHLFHCHSFHTIPSLELDRYSAQSMLTILHKHLYNCMHYCSHYNVFTMIYGHFQRPNTKWKWLNPFILHITEKLTLTLPGPSAGVGGSLTVTVA